MKLSEVINAPINENTILIFESGKYIINSGTMHINEVICTTEIKNLIAEDLYNMKETNNVVVLNNKEDNELDISFTEITTFDKMYVLESCYITLGGNVQINTINSSSLFESDLTLEQENKIADRLHNAKRIKI